MRGFIKTFLLNVFPKIKCMLSGLILISSTSVFKNLERFPLALTVLTDALEALLFV